nr:hypothetical protein [Homoserinimonas sp. OAct 916]
MPEPVPKFSRVFSGFERVLSVQRPVVLAHIRRIRRRNPNATPARIIQILERRYQAAVTTGGAAVGATAVVPGIGTGITLSLSGIETMGFLEASALFAQSISEVHGLAVEDPQRASALVMTMMLGDAGASMVRQLAGEFTGISPLRSDYWGELITAGLPQFVVSPLSKKLRSEFTRRFAVSGTAGVVGKVIPFGVGAAVGGVGNFMLSRKVVSSSRQAFLVVRSTFPAELEPGSRLGLTDTEQTAVRRIFSATRHGRLVTPEHEEAGAPRYISVDAPAVSRD